MKNLLKIILPLILGIALIPEIAFSQERGEIFRES